MNDVRDGRSRAAAGLTSRIIAVQLVTIAQFQRGAGDEMGKFKQLIECRI